MWLSPLGTLAARLSILAPKLQAWLESRLVHSVSVESRRKPGLETAGLALTLLLVNVYICRELFRVEYLNYMGSIEGAFIGMSRYVMGHWRDLTWFPLWNGGTPFPTTYPPLLNLTVAFSAWLSGASPAHAYHWVTALAFCLGPVALFALTYRLSGSQWAGFVAGLIYSSVSWSYWIIPAIGRDVGGPFHSRRFQALVEYGEGPHVASMTLLTVALLFLDVAMTRRRAHWITLASVVLAATALTNWLGAFGIVLIVAPYALAQLGRGGWKTRDLALVALIGAAAYGLAIPLMPPSTIATLQKNAQSTGGNYAHVYQAALPQGLAVLAALIVIKLAISRLPRHLQFGILFAFLMTLVAAGDAVWNIAIVPMAFRYHLEMEMALAMLAGFVCYALFRSRPRRVVALAIAVLVLSLIQPLKIERRQAAGMLRPIDITKTIEWKTAQWLNHNWNGSRVFVPGSVAFWLNAFSDTPELWGFEQATTNPINRDVTYVVYHGDPTGAHETDSAVLWMKALGVHAVGVSGPLSSAPYKDFVKPRKFDGFLEPLWRDGDDTLYRVSEDAELARVVPREALVSRKPIHALDLDPLRPYVAALDDPKMPRADFRWTSAHSATINAKLDPGQIVSVQMAWHQGWRATVNGRAAPVQRDAIGQMYIDPEISGPCTIEMIYDGGMETGVAYAVCALTALLLAAASIRSLLKPV